MYAHLVLIWSRSAISHSSLSNSNCRSLRRRFAIIASMALQYKIAKSVVYCGGYREMMTTWLCWDKYMSTWCKLKDNKLMADFLPGSSSSLPSANLNFKNTVEAVSDTLNSVLLIDNSCTIRITPDNHTWHLLASEANSLAIQPWATAWLSDLLTLLNTPFRWLPGVSRMYGLYRWFGACSHLLWVFGMAGLCDARSSKDEEGPGMACRGPARSSASGRRRGLSDQR